MAQVFRPAEGSHDFLCGVARRDPAGERRSGDPGGCVAVDGARQPAAHARAPRNAGAAPRRKPRGRHGRERRQLRLDAGVRRSGDRARRDIRADHHRVRRRPRQPQRVPRQPASSRGHRRRGGRVHRAADLSQRRDHRPVRARPRDPRARLLRGVRRVFLPVSSAGHRDGDRVRAAVRIRAPVAVRSSVPANDA